MKNRHFMFVILTLIMCSISFPVWAEESESPGSGYSQPISSPSVCERVAIVYPQLALQYNIQGTVILTATVTEDGEVSDVIVGQSSGYLVLDDAAVENVNNWKFIPAHDANGKAIKSIVRLPVVFKLE